MSLIQKLTNILVTGSNPVIIEPGTSTFKSFAAKNIGGEIRLLNCETCPAPEGFSLFADSNESSFDPEAVAEAFQNLIVSKKYREKYVSLILPDQAFCSGNFIVPKVAAKAGMQPLLEREIRCETNKTSENFKIRYEMGSVTGNKIPVFYFALPKYILDNLIAIQSRLKFITLSIQPSFMGIVKLLKLNLKNEKLANVFLHLGNEAVTAGIIKDGELSHLQIINQGIHQLIQRLSNDLDMPFSEAEKILKEKLILLEEPENEAQLEIPEYVILESVLADILQKIYGFLILFTEEGSEQEGFGKIILSGGGAAFRNFDRLIEANLGIPTIKLSDEVEKIPGVGNFKKLNDFESFLPLLGNFLLQPWQRNRFDRAFAA
ncbi:MAG: hypothetical protein ACQETH_12125 [Candidatus Rifleibacteriota bacterium]